LTLHLLDVASYQGTLAPADVVRAGFSAVNLKVSHGLGRKSVHPDITGWVADAHQLGLGICTFHYMTAEASGEAQAEHAYARLVALGLQDPGSAHQLDVESTPPPTLAMVRGYLARMTELLRRPVVLYTGDWWWQARGGWNVADLTPYLWAAPNAGYLGTYPGDTGSHWLSGYGGWKQLSVMQYGVGKLRFPDGTTGGIDVSKSAIRDGAVWRDLTLGRPGMSYAPATLKAARTLYIDLIKGLGYNINPLSVGIVGDDSHANSGTSYHLGKDALKAGAYSVVESSRDRNPTDAAMALDLGWFSIKVDGQTHNLRTFSRWLVDQCEANTADTRDIREVIYSLDGDNVKRWDRLGRRTTGDSSHTSHTHISYFRDSESRDKSALIRRYFDEITGDDMADLTQQNLNDIANTTVQALLNKQIVAADDGTNYGSWNGTQVSLLRRSLNTQTIVTNLAASVNAIGVAAGSILANVQADDADRAVLLAAITAAETATAAAAAEAVRDTFGGPEASAQDVANALIAALGAEKAAAVKAAL
jgi:hypothetical protein